MRLNPYVWVQFLGELERGEGFGRPSSVGGVDGLPVQVAHRHEVMIDHAHTTCRPRGIYELRTIARRASRVPGSHLRQRRPGTAARQSRGLRRPPPGPTRCTDGAERPPQSRARVVAASSDESTDREALPWAKPGGIPARCMPRPLRAPRCSIQGLVRSLGQIGAPIWSQARRYAPSAARSRQATLAARSQRPTSPEQSLTRSLLTLALLC